VLWLIEVRLDIWSGLARRGTEEEKQDAPGILAELEELEQAVRRGGSPLRVARTVGPGLR
jgi:hypothetical protein